MAAGSQGFVGRAVESAVVDQAVQVIRAGRPAVVLISGESGMGKSRLLHEALLRAGPDMVIARGAANSQPGAHLPFEPWIPILDDVLRRFGDSPREACRSLGVHSPTLAGILPALHDSEVPADSSRIAAEIVRLLRSASHRRPVVVALDDLQWADDAALRVVASLVSVLQQERLALLIGSRVPTGLSGTGEFRAALDRIQRSPHLSSVTLGPLTKAESLGLLADYGLAGQQGEEILRAAGGSPFLLHEMARQPATVVGPSRYVLASLSALRPDGLAAVQALAAGGRPMPFDIAARTIELWLGADGAGALDEARDLGVVRPSHGAGSELELAHELIGAEALSRLSADGVRGLHSAALDAWGESDQDVPSGLLALHARRSGRVDEAVRHALAAAAEARALHAYRDAETQLDYVRQHWRSGTPGLPEGLQRSDVALLCIRNADDAGDIDKAFALLESEKGRAQPGSEFRGRLLLREASALLRGLRGAEGVAALEQALGMLRDPQERLDALSLLASAHLQSGQRLRIDPIADEARQLADTIGTAAARARWRTVEAACKPTFAAAGAQLEEALGAAPRLEFREHVELTTDLAHALFLAGRETASLTWLRAAMEEVEGLGPAARAQRCLLAGLSAYVLWLRGQWSDALRLVGVAGFGEGERSGAFGEVIRDRLLVLQTLEPPGRRPSTRIASPIDHARLATALEYAFWAGAPTDGMALAQQDGVSPYPSDDAYLAWLQSRAYAEVGEAPAAGEWPMPSTAVDAGRIEIKLPEADGMALLCTLERRRARGSDTADDWQEAADRLEVVTRPYPAAYARWRAAELLVHAGDIDGAARQLRASHATAAKLQCGPLITRLERLATLARVSLQIDAKVPAVSLQGPLARLTPREREVLGLIAAGRTNGDIARELSITVKTAGTHVSNILRKLSAPNRFAAGAMVTHTAPA